MLKILTILVLNPLVLAHDDADWIRQNPDTSYCCGPSDCHRIPDTDIIALPNGGWRYVPTGEEFRKKDTNVHRSIDGNFWRCISNQMIGGYGRIPQNATRCFFYTEPNS